MEPMHTELIARIQWALHQASACEAYAAETRVEGTDYEEAVHCLRDALRALGETGYIDLRPDGGPWTSASAVAWERGDR